MKLILTRKMLADAARTKPKRQVQGGQEFALDDKNPLPNPPPDVPSVDAPPIESDTYAQRVYKLIPAEVTAGYIALLSGVGLLTASDAAAATRVASDDTTKWAPALAIVIGTLWALLALRAEGLKLKPAVKPMRRQYLLTTLAFWAWAASISDPFLAVGRAIPAWILFFAIVLIPTLGAYWMNQGDE